MNCNDIEHLLLLAQSGELNEKDFKKLKEHVESCDHCQRFESNLNGITKLAQRSLPAGEPTEASLAAIRLAGQNEAARRPRLFFPSLRIAAYAAAVLGFVAGWIILGSDNRAERAEELSAILAMVEESEPLENDALMESVSNEELKELARQLLRMEGLLTDDLLDTTLPSSPSGPPPTTLRWRSTDELPGKKCV